MDIFSQIIREFSFTPWMESWDEAQAIFRYAAYKKPKHWLLPLRACEAVGGTQQQAFPAILAVGCAHISILLVDDMLDNDPRGDYHRIGMPNSANLACAFQAAGLHIIAQLIQDEPAKLAAMNDFNNMLLSTAFGQFLDVQKSMDETLYWKTAQAKSSPFFGTALQVGALSGGGTIEVAGQLKKLGYLYGEMIQIHDDMHDSMEISPNPDWIQGHFSLPILFASLVKHPEQDRFLELNQHITETGALQEAQEILIRCGAISYCADQLIQKHQSAKEILYNIPLTDHTPVDSLLDEIIAPINGLLESVKL